MNDCFALLNEPRRPWLDPEALKKKYFALSAEFHPDRVHNGPPGLKSSTHQRYAEINAAYNRLRDPKERLSHFLELERGHKLKETQQVSPEVSIFFDPVNSLCREADALLQEKNRMTSPLLQVTIFERGQELTERLFELQRQVNSEREQALAEIQRMDSTWEETSDREATLLALEELYPVLSYFTRWSGQIQERIVQLAS
jgi:curved DNA-binding protein CbpA